MTKAIWFITGSRGSGKSTAACRFARPSEIDKMVVVDTEDSLSDILRQNGEMGVSFGGYIRAYERFNFTGDMLDLVARGKLPWVSSEQQVALADYWTWFVHILNKTLSSEHRYLVIDTIEPIEAAATAWVESNKRKAGWSGRLEYGKKEVEGVRPLLDNTFEAFHRRGITDILITSHTKNPWVEYAPRKSKPVLDKLVPGGRLKLWSLISTAMLWMRRPPYPPNPTGAPSAIVLKARAGDCHVDVERDDWVTQSSIPPRIPAFDWAEWRRYVKEGWNPLGPEDGETLLPDEQRLLSELLSDQEYQLMIIGAQVALEEERQSQTPVLPMTSGTFTIPARPPEENNTNRIKELAAEGKSTAEIAAETGLPEAMVRAMGG